ncbi:MAG: hypothetical protein QW044_01955 [Candidatus Anstonellales archaeon]
MYTYQEILNRYAGSLHVEVFNAVAKFHLPLLVDPVWAPTNVAGTAFQYMVSSGVIDSLGNNAVGYGVVGTVDVPLGKGANSSVRRDCYEAKAIISIDAQNYETSPDKERFLVSEITAGTAGVGLRIVKEIFTNTTSGFPWFLINGGNAELIPVVEASDSTGETAWLVSWSPGTSVLVYPQELPVGLEIQEPVKTLIQTGSNRYTLGYAIQVSWKTAVACKSLGSAVAITGITENDPLTYSVFVEALSYLNRVGRLCLYASPQVMAGLRKSLVGSVSIAQMNDPSGIGTPIETLNGVVLREVLFT